MAKVTLAVLIFINVIIISVGVSEDAPPRVAIPLGDIEGSQKETVKGRTIFAFEGVPYARPPVGKYRFKTPQIMEHFNPAFLHPQALPQLRSLLQEQGSSIFNA
ncbi:hypothetical protein NQ318_008406 [Aromia moschata]|uniref:Carboxylesterase type B domain-containing protein n=1 Tax=Aromia moschata TaxID=1265417 RepID=A0AAV8X5J5_9CUCU|nr:hypothetical protein NQ318_008406 [Aromia moschata]